MNPVQALEMASGIESWLLDSCIQIPDGPQRGGVAGWLDWLGKPAFVYPEITGYYLTWLAFLNIASRDQSDRIRSRAGAALGWLASWLESDRLPPTRIYPLPETEDWRNRVTFSFDLAMLWRGVRAARMAHLIEAPDLSLLEKALVASIDGTTFQPCLSSSEPAGSVPIRWSTLPGPHQLKLAAAFLRADGDDLPGMLRRAAVRVSGHWRRVIAERQIRTESHAALYALEGLLSAGIAENDSEALALAAQAYRQIVERMNDQRSDVLAQALRIGCVLRSSGHLPKNRAGDRLASLASRLARCVAPTGAVSFFEPGAGRGFYWNSWSGLFAHQAFRFLAKAAHGETMDPLWIRLIV